MCTTCGCGAGNTRIENIDRHDHSHSHDHDHHHGEHHSHHHAEEHQHDHSHNQAGGINQVIHHHYYYNQVHVHHYPSAPNSVAPHGHHRSHAHHHPEAHSHCDHVDHEHHEEERFEPELSGEDLHYGEGAAHSHAPGMTQSRMVQIEQDILAKNDAIAERNRAFLQSRNIKALNLVSSPGSGKTTLLTETLKRLDTDQCIVIEGDQQTTNDADRIRETGAQAIQINTGKGCHLDAQMVADAIARLLPEQDTTLFIENVGNLVCPAAFDLGESHKVAILSVTEGEDKPLKYPDIFADADLMLINKIDLIPYLNFDLDACTANAKRVNPDLEILLVSASSGEGMQVWLDWLGER
ncbi:hydrogenase nickel incorporation protein HypB [Vibrio sp. RC27]